jgi:hypothetical protein
LSQVGVLHLALALGEEFSPNDLRRGPEAVLSPKRVAHPQQQGVELVCVPSIGRGERARTFQTLSKYEHT